MFMQLRVSYGASSLPLKYGVEIHVSSEQSSPTTVKIVGDEEDGICSLTQPDSAIATTNYVGSTHIGNDDMIITVTKTGSQESLLMVSNCMSGGKTFNTDIPVYFAVGAPSPWVSATGDPHFAQSVRKW
ncbi:DgyrCDS14685 [Dimorphilus gyrociliatus]|uniref:DgyrCDS14685 n=1 Tax=Dimorphilus gyrociliatus TaxID=2664684 RepID=A0A7I8WEN2_9ANNE|nr:DgyrCDS14685 [Dimorphilus gyrociliatus]